MLCTIYYQKAKFSREPLEIFGSEVFGNLQLKDVPKKILINSFLLDNGLERENRSWEPRLYHNLPLKPDYETKEGYLKYRYTNICHSLETFSK